MKATTAAKPTSYKKQRITQFKAQLSRLEHDSEFRGFITLFWTCLAIIIARTIYYQLKAHGKLKLTLIPIMSVDLLVFLLSDAIMVCFTMLALVLMKAVNGRYVPVWMCGTIQHLLQALLILGSVAWTFWRGWPWPQTATLSMHAVSMFMKMHSYISVNSDLERVSRKLETLKKSSTIIEKGKSPMTPTMRRRTRSSFSAPEQSDEIKSLESELIKGAVTYPKNLTLVNFIDYLAVPTLVYELSYPRTVSIRWPYAMEKAISFLGAVTLLYFNIEHFIMPVLEQMDSYTYPELIMELLIPFLGCWLILF